MHGEGRGGWRARLQRRRELTDGRYSSASLRIEIRNSILEYNEIKTGTISVYNNWNCIFFRYRGFRKLLHATNSAWASFILREFMFRNNSAQLWSTMPTTIYSTLGVLVRRRRRRGYWISPRALAKEREEDGTDERTEAESQQFHHIILIVLRWEHRTVYFDFHLLNKHRWKNKYSCCVEWMQVVDRRLFARFLAFIGHHADGSSDACLS